MTVTAYPLPVNLSVGPLFAGAGSVVTVTPGTNASVTVEHTLANLATVLNGQAEWIIWPGETVTVSAASNLVKTGLYLRLISTGAASSLQIDTPPISLPTSLVQAWDTALYITT